MNTLLATLTALTLLSAGADPAAADLSGEQIVDKMLQTNRVGFDTGQAKIRMRIKTPQGDIIDSKLLLRADRADSKTRMRMTFIEPDDYKGIEILILEQKGAPDLQYLYLPRFKKTRRMAGAQKNARFQGSDFTYADLESRDVKSGTYKRLEDTTFGKLPAFRVEVVPKQSPDEQYSKVDLWISKDHWLPLKTEFYDQAGKKLKVLKVKRIKKVDGRYVPVKLVMTNVQERSETLLEIQDINTKASFPDSMFTEQALGK